MQAAAAKVRDAYLSYARNTLPAPVTGYVAQRSVQVGQRVAPGTPLMAIVPLDGVWVDANFKEVQLKHMRIGQPVDADGRRVRLERRSTTARWWASRRARAPRFAVLPAQNATGNWIKVVQRLPVRIELDPQELEAHPLRIGLSMHADVEHARRSRAPSSAPRRTRRIRRTCSHNTATKPMRRSRGSSPQNSRRRVRLQRLQRHQRKRGAETPGRVIFFCPTI